MLLGRVAEAERRTACMPLRRITSIQHHIGCRHLATVRPLAVIPGMNHAQFSNGAQAHRCPLRLR